LDDIVSENVLHEFIGVRHQFVVDLLFLFWACGLDLLLNKSGAVLIGGEFDEVARDILNVISSNDK
jgi:hypothetical protein